MIAWRKPVANPRAPKRVEGRLPTLPISRRAALSGAARALAFALVALLGGTLVGGTPLGAAELSPHGSTLPPEARAPLILGVNPYLAPEELRARFQPLARILSHALGRSVEVRVGRDYEEHIRAIGEDRVDLAYVGPASRAHLILSYGPRPLLVRQEVRGQHMQQSVIAVRSDSPLTTPAALKGRRMAYSDRNSATGYLLASALLRQSGVDERSLGEVRFLNTQTNVALAVLAGDADAGSLRRETYEQFAGRGLRILATLPEVPDFGFIASRRLPAAEVESLRQTLLHLKDSPEGQAAMAGLHPGLVDFRPPDPADERAMPALIQAFAASEASR